MSRATETGNVAGARDDANARHALAGRTAVHRDFEDRVVQEIDRERGCDRDQHEVLEGSAAAAREDRKAAGVDEGRCEKPCNRDDEANVPIDHEGVAAAAWAGDVHLHIDARDALQRDLRRIHRCPPDALRRFGALQWRSCRSAAWTRY